MNQFIVVKDQDGNLLPMAGIWRLNDSGESSARNYANKPANKDITLVICELKEIYNYE